MSDVFARPAADPGVAAPEAASTVPRVRAERITKRFGHRAALRAMDLEVWPGERVVLFGPNGAGKTTLLRILATLSRPTSGTVWIDGLHVGREPQRVRRRVGVVAHQSYLYDDLTAGENLQFYARMYDVEGAERRIDEALRMVGLEERRDDRVRTFSRGMQQRLAIARATLHQPSLLLLDEPDAGLDREGIGVLEGLLARQAATGGSALTTTHDLDFGLAVADRVLLLQNGRVSLDAPAACVEVAEIERLLGYRR